MVLNPNTTKILLKKQSQECQPRDQYTNSTPKDNSNKAFTFHKFLSFCSTSQKHSGGFFQSNDFYSLVKIINLFKRTHFVNRYIPLLLTGASQLFQQPVGSTFRDGGSQKFRLLLLTVW